MGNDDRNVLHFHTWRLRLLKSDEFFELVGGLTFPLSSSFLFSFLMGSPFIWWTFWSTPTKFFLSQFWSYILVVEEIGLVV